MVATQNEGLSNLTAREIMQKGVAMVSPELTLSMLQEFLTGEEISGAPVVDENGALRGIVSKTDIVRFLSNDPTFFSSEAFQGISVEDIMTENVVTVGADQGVCDVARRMIDAGVHRVVVVEDDQIRGIVTTFDLLKVFI